MNKSFQTSGGTVLSRDTSSETLPRRSAETRPPSPLPRSAHHDVHTTWTAALAALPKSALHRDTSETLPQVLSTNWSEVKEKDYEKERTAPDGQEWKKWG